MLSPPVHSLTKSELLANFTTSEEGLGSEEVLRRQGAYGLNKIPSGKADSFLLIFSRQFVNPLIYLLVLAAALSFWLEHYTDGIFISVVLLFNAVIGSWQEYLAQQNVLALRSVNPLRARCRREGQANEIPAVELVPGDIVLVESGEKVPADIRLLSSSGLEVDESLLTGESIAVQKSDQSRVSSEALIAERLNMLHAGTLIVRGRAHGVVAKTGLGTELGQIAKEVLQGDLIKTPLMIRMESFTRWLAMGFVVASLIIGAALWLRGDSLTTIFLMAVALGVAAIPEGLPVALTIALSVASRKMAKRKVIVRKLAAVEALGSCTYIGTDKTGTLTLNKLRARQLVTPSGQSWIEGESLPEDFNKLLNCLFLCNEATQSKVGFQGDAVDVALKDLGQEHLRNLRPAEVPMLISQIAYESELQLAAQLYSYPGGEKWLYVKGAAEKILSLSRCDEVTKLRQVKHLEELSAQGFKVIAAAQKSFEGEVLKLNDLQDLEYLGLVGLVDPPREDAKEAIDSARSAGIDVAMITGDHPLTAFATAKELGLASEFDEVITGRQLKSATDLTKKDFSRIKVFARVEPTQKSEIVKLLRKAGHFVAITGDGANDAPALKSAHVGVAMGKKGTEVAKESSDLVISDDRFASIVNGIEEGRVAYNNIRKVIYLLISTGLAEIILFILSVASGYPLPLTAVQLLWLNLVTNGIQDVALAFEPAEGDELQASPRPPGEKIFNQVMIERVLLSSIIMGGVSFLVFRFLLSTGMSLFQVQNHILLLMVLFENIMIGNAKSEHHSALRMNPLKNPLLLGGAVLAQGIHLMAAFIPGLADVLGVSPVSTDTWVLYFVLALSVFIALELYKWLRPFSLKVESTP